MSNHEHSWLENLTRFLSREPRNQRELIEILRHAQERNLIDQDALQMIEGVLAVSDKKVRDIMVPRAQMVTIKSDCAPIDALPAVIQSQHSRFPVFDEHDKVLGILLAKDLLRFTINTQKTNYHLTDFVRPVVFVPENKPLDQLLKEFRLKRNHMAIIVNEYGSVVGLITIEDVLEEIVGEIEDEYDVDEKEPSIKEIKSGVYIVNAQTSLDEFNRYFATNLIAEDIETIGGLIVRHLGYLPIRNEKTIFHSFEVTIIKATRRGIQQMQFKKME